MSSHASEYSVKQGVVEGAERVEICKEIYQECEWAECRAESQARWPISSEDREHPGASWQPVSPICGASESVQ